MRYVPTNENPADFFTRGMTVSGMAEKVTWWNGPDFLEKKKKESDWPVNHVDTEVVLEEAEMKKTDQKCSTRSNQHKGNWTLMAVSDEQQSWRLSPKRFSSWKRLIRVHACFLRFIGNCKYKGQKEESGELSSEEIEDATSYVIRSTQRKAFPDEYSALQSGIELPKNSKLLGLYPKLDEGQIRCDGRLKYAELLPHDAHLTYHLAHIKSSHEIDRQELS